MRGPNRELIGEATVTEVRVDEESPTVYVTIESTIDPGQAGISDVASKVVGRRDIPAMSFRFLPEPISLPHQPKRDDDVARWLRKIRDQYQPSPFDSRESGAYWALDGVLDEYRARADYGLTLDDDLSQLPDGW